MGDHFKTDVDQLDEFVRTLNDSVKDLDEARTALSHVRGDQIGTSRLDEACDGFQDRWKYGSEQISEMIGGIKEGVKANKLSYQEMETNLEKALKQMEQQGTSAGGGK
jgi:exonuclease VII small subunit